eukprot:GFYU01011969.1.p1 GENE.GFYU01011969.1~~GFYU01011969.1.p1  ORF type:complete len:705 (+),score=161.02 GFYU01011969.1:310-2424(+)
MARQSAAAASRPPLLWKPALQGDADEIVKLLETPGLDKYKEVNAPDVGGRTPLIWAAFKGHEDCVRVLVKNGAQLDAIDAKGQSALALAAANGFIDVASYLIKKGAGVDLADKDGKTPLCWVCDLGHVEVAAQLVDNGADIEHVDEEGFGPIHFAALAGRAQTAYFLIKAGARLTALNDAAKTELLSAAVRLESEEGGEGVSLDLVRRLLKASADVSLRDKKGRTPLQWAHPAGVVFNELLSAGASMFDANEDKVRRQQKLTTGERVALNLHYAGLMFGTVLALPYLLIASIFRGGVFESLLASMSTDHENWRWICGLALGVVLTAAPLALLVSSSAFVSLLAVFVFTLAMAAMLCLLWIQAAVEPMFLPKTIRYGGGNYRISKTAIISGAFDLVQALALLEIIRVHNKSADCILCHITDFNMIPAIITTGVWLVMVAKLATVTVVLKSDGLSKKFDSVGLHSYHYVTHPVVATIITLCRWILFVPVTVASFRVLGCDLLTYDNDLFDTCWSGSHLVYVVFALVVQLWYILPVTVVGTHIHKALSGQFTRSTESMFYLVFSVVKYFLCASFILIGGYNTVFPVVFSLVCHMILFSLALRWQPHSNTFSNYFQYAVHLSASCASLAYLIDEYVDDPASFEIIYLVGVIVPVAILTVAGCLALLRDGGNLDESMSDPLVDESGSLRRKNKGKKSSSSNQPAGNVAI